MNLSKRYQKLFTRQNISRQLMLLFIYTILIPVIIAGVVILAVSSRQLTRQYERLGEAQVSQIHSVLVTTTLYLHEIYETIAEDKELRRLLSDTYPSAQSAELAFSQYSGFNNTMKNEVSISAWKLYADAEILKRDTPVSFFYPITDEVKQESWYARAMETRENFYGTAVRSGRAGTSYWELTYYCHIPIPKSSSYALLVLSVSNDYLNSLIQSSGYDVYISVNDDPVFYSTNRSYPGKNFPVEPDPKSGSFRGTKRLSLFGKTAIASVRSLQPTQTSDTLYIIAANPNALSEIHRVQLLIILCIVFALLLSLLLITAFSRYFSSRVRTLRLAMHKVSNNDYEIVNAIHGDDELSATFQDLRTMVEKLKKTESQIYESQIREQMLSNQQQQMELKLLANQINPHFLYNTLETIRMKAFSEGSREVANAIKLLGKSMRYVLGNTRTAATTLDKELDYIRTYLAIQKLRFAERVGYLIEIEDGLQPERYQILPLLIQPIVENAISHGIEPTGKAGHISLHIFRSADGMLTAKVCDDGTGMDENTLQEVTAHLTVPRRESERGIGLYNINSRIQLYYGVQNGLSIQSRPGRGTEVTLTIPLHNLTEEEA